MATLPNNQLSYNLKILSSSVQDCREFPVSGTQTLGITSYQAESMEYIVLICAACVSLKY